MSSHYNEIKEKRQILRDIYGGMMTIADLTRELGYGSPRSTRTWLATVGVEAVRVGRGIRYETDQVAKCHPANKNSKRKRNKIAGEEEKRVPQKRDGR